jgi:hypothetical protein
LLPRSGPGNAEMATRRVPGGSLRRSVIAIAMRSPRASPPGDLPLFQAPLAACECAQQAPGRLLAEACESDYSSTHKQFCATFRRHSVDEAVALDFRFIPIGSVGV